MTEKGEGVCPKCKGKMEKSGTSLCSNSTYVTFKCMACSHTVTKCTGMLPEKQRY